MASLAERIIEGRLDRQVEELETSLRVTGQIFEVLPLSLGDTTIEREILPDGSRGSIRVCTQEAVGLIGSFVTYRHYTLKDGQVELDPAYGEGVASRFRKAQLLAKVVLGKVDHWDKEGDFYGVEEEY